MRSLKRVSEDDIQVNSLDSLEGELKQYFNKICELAFIYLSTSSLMPSDFIAIAYVMSTSSRHVSRLVFCNCIFDRVGIRTLLTKVEPSTWSFIKHIILKI